MPLSTKRLSSVETAKLVFRSIPLSLSWGMTTVRFCAKTGRGGNSSAAKPFTLKNALPARIEATDFSSVSISISVAINSRVMSTSFLTGKVARPPSSTVALTEQVMVTSRSVAVRERRRSPASRRTLERIGSVEREPTMFWTA